MTTPALELQGIRKVFGDVVAIDELDLTIGCGEVVALLGPNGAGKSTTIDIALGLSTPTVGLARLFGAEPRRAIVGGRVGVMLQGGALLPTLTVGQSVALIAAAHRHPLSVDEALERAGIRDLAKRRISRLSGGQLQRARFAVAIVSNPQLLLLDEPTAAMDVETRRDFWASMRDYTAQGRTVVFATHYLDEAEHSADRIVIMKEGRVAADGTPEVVRSAVTGTVIRFSVDDRDADAMHRAIRGNPGLGDCERHGGHFAIVSADSDRALRFVLESAPSVRGIDVTKRSMDDAFLALTATTAPSRTIHENQEA